MRNLFTILLFAFTSFILNAQNLVPNPSFEDTVSCPIGGDQLYKAQFWSSFRHSPDYFHSCCNQINNSVVGVPSNDLGFQYPNSGNAYAGVIAYDLTGAPYREYLGVLLYNPLVSGTKYYLSLFINWSGKIGFTIASNKFGVAISDSLYSITNPYPMNNSPIAYSDSIINDSLNWNQIKLEFVANTNANYLILGNFFDDANTDTMHLGQFNLHAYYYIDDICLSTDSNFCYSYSGNLEIIQSNNTKGIVENYYFIDDKLFIKFNDFYKQKQIQIVSMLGQIVYKYETVQSELIIPYFKNNDLILVKILSQNNTQTLKLIR